MVTVSGPIYALDKNQMRLMSTIERMKYDEHIFTEDEIT